MCSSSLRSAGECAELICHIVVKKMPPIAEEQESQIVPDIANEPPSDDFDYGSDQHGMNGDGIPQIDVPESFKRSRVEETQYADLELDTQANNTQPSQELRTSSPITRLLRPDSAPRSDTVDTSLTFSLFKRPDVHEELDPTNFKFGTARKPIPNAFIRPPKVEGISSHTVASVLSNKGSSHETHKDQGRWLVSSKILLF